MAGSQKTLLRIACQVGVSACVGLAVLTYQPAPAAENSVLKDILARINNQKAAIAQIQADHKADQQALAVKEQALAAATARRNPAEIKAATSARDAARTKADNSYQKAKAAEEAECVPCKDLESYLAGINPADLTQPVDPNKLAPQAPKTPPPGKVAASVLVKPTKPGEKKPAVTPSKPAVEVPEEESVEEMVEEVSDEEMVDEEIVDEEMAEDAERTEEAEMVEDAEMVPEDASEEGSLSAEEAPVSDAPDSDEPSSETPSSEAPSVDE